MSAPQRAQGQAPSAAMLHPVWHPTTKGEPPSEEFVARCLLGAGWVGANRRLSMLDLRVWAALCAMLGEQLPMAPPHDPELQRIDTRTVETTGYQLAERGCSAARRRSVAVITMLAGSTANRRSDHPRDRGRSRPRSPTRHRRLCAADRRDVDRDYAARSQGPEGVGCSEGHRFAPRRGGSLGSRADRRRTVQVAGPRSPACPWPGPGGSCVGGARGWARWPQRSFDGREETAIGLGKPALESLGVGGYARPRRAARHLTARGSGLSPRIPPTSSCAARSARAGA